MTSSNDRARPAQGDLIATRRRLGIAAATLLAAALGAFGACDDADDPAAPTPPAQTPATSTLPGEWQARAPLPLPRSEMATVAELDGKMYVMGGYADQKFDQPINQVYDPAANSWATVAPLPRGVNHVAVIGHNGKVYAAGGFTKQNNTPVADFAEYTPATNTWRALAPLPSPRGALALAVVQGKIHAVGGRDSVSVGTHDVYDPATGKWAGAAPLPAGRDHLILVTVGTNLHAVGGRFNTFEYNTGLHHVYAPGTDQWKTRAPMPTPRSGHAGALYKGRILAIGGEVLGGVFTENEAYDPVTDTWTALRPIPTGRLGTGAAVIGDWVYVPGGGPVNGGAIQSSVHEAFRLP